MDLQVYLQRADACLRAVTTWLEDFDPDELDFTTGDGLVTLEFADGTRYVLNRQSGNHQMWFAAGARAWHYVWDDATAAWVDERDRHLLYARLGEVVATKLGRTVAAPGAA